MNALRKYLDKIRPHFEKGGRLEKLHSTFDAFDTFLYTPDRVTMNGSHIRDANDLKRTMAVVVIALLPPMLFGMWNIGHLHFLSQGETAGFWSQFGYGFFKVLPIIVVSYVVGLGIEFAVAQIRGHEVNEGFLVTGILIPLIVPPEIPLWELAIATAFAVIIGKEVFGGTGMNILNPALVARAFLFFAYPGDMTGDKIWIAHMGDAISGATPLGNAMIGQFDKIPPVSAMFFGTIPGSVGETSTLAILIGAVILLVTGMGNWRIMLTVFLGGYLMALLFNAVGTSEYMRLPAYEHLIMGGFAFGAVYMATDPVTAAQTNRGKYIYGFLIGIFAVLIRVVNPGYPEGVMLAILFMNVFAPLIDYYIIQTNIRRRLRRLRKPLTVQTA